MRSRAARYALIAVAAIAAVGGAAFAGWTHTREARIDAVASLRATHYWAGVYPKNFWDGLDAARVDRDFERIRGDGFNAIVLAVSWTDFQPRLTPAPAYDERAFASLALLMAKARAHGLRVALRVGFPWSFRPDAELPNAERIDAAFADPRVRAAWLAFVDEVCRRACADANLALAFLSWEDLTPFNLLGAEPNRAHPGFRREFVGFLRERHTLDAIGDRYGRRFATWDDVGVPARREAAFALALDWWDHALIEDFVRPARKRFPGLALEVRIDQDPVWRDGAVHWNGHHKTIAGTGADATIVYFHTAWGMKNEGDRVAAPPVLAALDRLLGDTRKQAKRSALFVDQFNFFDNTPGFARNTRLAESAFDPMLAGSAAILARHRAGYALWTDTDYVASILYNARFRRGLDGLTAIGAATPVGGDDTASSLRLAPGAAVAQRVVAAGREDGFALGERGTVCVEGRSLAAGDAPVRVTGLPGAAIEMALPASGARRCAEAPLAPEFTFTLAAGNAPIAIAGVELYRHTQRSRVYTIDGTPGPQRDAIRALNRELARLAEK